MKKQIYALFTQRQKSKFRFGKNKKFTISNNRYFVKFNIQGLFVLFALFLAVNSHGQSLEIISPNGGENWLRETDQTIRWVNNGEPADLAIEYSTDAGNTWYYLAYMYSADSLGEYTFLNYMYASDSALVRISNYNDPSVNDVSDATFMITDPPITIYNPWNGSEYYRTSPIDISWYADSIQTFKLEFSSDNGVSWTEVANNISDFNYTFTAPDLLSDECYIKVSDANNPDDYALSTSFSITELPVVSIISPNGGETWNFGELNEVSWTGSDLPYYLYLELSIDGGNSWEYLGYAYGADTGGTSTAYLPNVNTSQARIKISDPSFAGVSDSSDANFTIFTPPVIMYYPQQGDEFYNQSQTSISWLASGIDTVNIELSTDNGQSWTMIEENYYSYSNGYYFWTVSGDPSNQCIIKVSDATDPASYGLSEVFTILPTPVVSFTSPQSGDIWNTETEYTISWTYDNPNSYYLYLEYSSNGGQSWNNIGYVPNEDMNGSYQWTTPAIESDQYVLRIRDNGLSFVSDTSDVFSIKSFPETPICIVSADESSNNNTVVWEKPVSSLIDKFVVYKESESANVFLPIGEIPYDSIATFTDTSSNIVSSSPTALNDVEGLASLKVYPNPVNELLGIELGEADGPFDLRLSNLLGKTVYRQTISNFNKKTHFIRTAELQEGIYVLSLQNIENSYSKRIIVKH